MTKEELEIDNKRLDFNEKVQIVVKKEELEKDYYADRPTEPYFDDDKPRDWASLAHYAEDNLEKAFKRIEELEKVNAELNKLRCCENCKNVNLQLHWRESKKIDEMRQRVCGTCGNRKNWEYLGKTVEITETQQLTKAKEIIYRLMDIINHDLKCFDTMAGGDIKQKAEQFLKE